MVNKHKKDVQSYPLSQNENLSEMRYYFSPSRLIDACSMAIPTFGEDIDQLTHDWSDNWFLTTCKRYLTVIIY